jgi:Transposase DDE domain
VHRTTLLRQAANLWRLKEAFWQRLAAPAEQATAVTLLDSLPVPVCRSARAHRGRSFAGVASFGYDPLAHQTLYGLRLHLRVAWPGVITAFGLAPASAHDLAVAPALLEGARGWALGDGAYWRPALKAELAPAGLTLQAPPRAEGAPPWPPWLVQTRRRIETILSQLTERYHAKQVRARDAWHLAARWLRKVLSHTLAVLFCQGEGLSPLALAHLVTA